MTRDNDSTTDGTTNERDDVLDAIRYALEGMGDASYAPRDGALLVDSGREGAAYAAPARDRLEGDAWDVEQAADKLHDDGGR